MKEIPLTNGLKAQVVTCSREAAVRYKETLDDALAEVIEKATQLLAPHPLAYYALDLASPFHGCDRECRVVSSDAADSALSCARLRLVDATKSVFARVLGLMGVQAPESM